MSLLDDVARRDSWRCWVCDEPVDADKSVNDPVVRASTAAPPTRVQDRRAPRPPCLQHPQGRGQGGHRLAGPSARGGARAADHRRGATERKGGRELVARCPSRSDAQEAADWLVDRFSRLVPGLPVTASVEAGGGQYLVALATGRR
ncbi:hypothetical protein NKG94_03010 [Micromonospora sp. M12]